MQYAPPVHQESYLETERREIKPGISICTEAFIALFNFCSDFYKHNCVTILREKKYKRCSEMCLKIAVS